MSNPNMSIRTLADQQETIQNLTIGLPPEDREHVKVAYDEIKQLVERHGDCGLFAFALLGSEYARQSVDW